MLLLFIFELRFHGGDVALVMLVGVSSNLVVRSKKPFHMQMDSVDGQVSESLQAVLPSSHTATQAAFKETIGSPFHLANNTSSKTPTVFSCEWAWTSPSFKVLNLFNEIWPFQLRLPVSQEIVQRTPK